MADQPKTDPPHGMEKYDLGGQNDLGALSKEQQESLNRHKVWSMSKLFIKICTVVRHSSFCTQRFAREVLLNFHLSIFNFVASKPIIKVSFKFVTMSYCVLLFCWLGVVATELLVIYLGQLASHCRGPAVHWFYPP